MSGFQRVRVMGLLQDMYKANVTGVLKTAYSRAWREYAQYPSFRGSSLNLKL